VIDMKKDIAFIYMDSAEKSMYQPIAREAEKRGYRVRLTDNKFERCEIGFYCQHVNFPQYSKFSVIMLHDIIQQFGNWPDIWYMEPWNKYDVGFLPSNQWEENWTKASGAFYARPRRGVYKVGWPKADVIADLDIEAYRRSFYREHGLDPGKKTVLYAPSWENDGKQDDFVQAMLKLDVNILIKQYNASETLYPEVYRAIRAMYELHRDLPRVTILDPATNIFDAILAADILVSEESSTMAEAAMMGVPSVSVSDWLIPDVTPSRYPVCHYEFAIVTPKAALTDCVRDIIAHYDAYRQKILDFREKNFSNIGQTARIVMDVVDACVSGQPAAYPALTPAPAVRVPFMKDVKRRLIQFKLQVYYNWSKQYRIVGALWKGMASARHALQALAGRRPS